MIILERKMLGCDVGAYQCATRICIDRTVFAAHEIEHQFGLVIELNAEPIPTDLIFAQLVAAELVIHPTESANFLLLTVKDQLAFGLHAGERIIIGCSAFAFALLTQAVLTMQRRRFE